MDELTSIVTRAMKLREDGERFLLATVVRVRGSSYRRPGARMLVTELGSVTGSISGGCLEGDVARKGFWRTQDRDAVVVTYDATSDEDVRSGFGIGCNGVVEVLLEIANAEDECDPITLLERCLEGERGGGMATVFASRRDDVSVGQRFTIDGASHETSNVKSREIYDELATEARAITQTHEAARAWTSSDGKVEALIEAIVPPPHLFVFGSGADVVPIVLLAKQVGWSVSVCDRQAHFETRERFLAADERLILDAPSITRALASTARPLAIVISHNYEQDRAALAELLESRAEYIGVLGPRARTERMLAEIEYRTGPIPPSALARLHAPVGLDLGAETPAEVALAIVAEAQATLTHRSGRRLRERMGGIHGEEMRSLAGSAE